MKLKRLFVLTAAVSSFPALACTLWGAAGGDGSLLAKNRDWKPDHLQSVRLVEPSHGLRYVGLYADDGSEPGLKEGVNEAGLSVVSAEASSLPKAVRHAEPQKRHLLFTLLSQYHDLDEVAAHAQTLFTDNRPVFLMLADGKGLMQVEIGQNGRYAITRSQDGTLAHTNHYFDAGLIDYPQKIGPSSAARLDRVKALLAESAQPHSLAEFERISGDRHDGPDNSLWRDGKEYTLAGWQIELPSHGAPHLHLVLANPGKQRQEVDLRLDAAFWQQPERVLLGNGHDPA